MLKDKKETLYIRYKKDYYLEISLEVTDNDTVIPHYRKVECRKKPGKVLFHPLDIEQFTNEGIHDALSFIADYPDGVEARMVDFTEPRIRRLRAIYPSLSVGSEYRTSKEFDDGYTLEDALSEDLWRYNWMWWMGIGHEKLRDREKAIKAINEDGIIVSYLKWKEAERYGVDDSFLNKRELDKILRFGQDIRGYYGTLLESGF